MWAQNFGVGMAQSGEDRRKKCQHGAGTIGAPQVGKAVCRTGDQDPAPPLIARPAAIAQMHASMQCGGEPYVAGYHQRETTVAADASEIAAKRRSIGIVVVP
jgi:hypothetical protein